MNENPYAAPSADSSTLDSDKTSSVTIRNTYLKHEASVKSIGTLYIIGGLLLIVSAILATSASLAVGDSAYTIAYGLGMTSIAALQLWLGFSLRKLRKGARLPAILVAVIGLIGFPIGTLISAYILSLLCSQKGAMIFSPKYAQVIADTPEIKYRTSAIVWAILILFIIILVVGFIFIAAQ